MKLTNNLKLKMCEEHLIQRKSLSHICEEYGTTDVSKLKYWINLYKKHDKKVFLDRSDGVYRRDTKLLTIGRVKNGESIRAVSIDLGLIDPSILRDWIKKYDQEGDESIQDTYPRKNYLLKDEKYKEKIDKTLKEENERLRAEIDFLKKSQSLARKIEELTTKDKVKVVNELRAKYNLKVLLNITQMASSVFYYQLNSIKQSVNKYEEIEKKIDYLYLERHKKRIGYQRIYIELKK